MFNGSKISSTTDKNNIATLSGADQLIEENSSPKADNYTMKKVSLTPSNLLTTTNSVNKSSINFVTDASIEPVSDKSMILNEPVTANNVPSL